MINTISNDYLGLANHPTLVETLSQSAKQYGIGSTGSRRLSGNHTIHIECEQVFSKWLNKEDAILFNSGYQMNSSIFSSFLTKNSIVVAYKYCHASLIDGVTHSDGRLIRFKHNNMTHLDQCLNRASKMTENPNDIWILCESVYSMDGDSPNFNELCKLKYKYNVKLIVDEAHGIGIFGDNGQGLCHKTNTLNNIDLLLLAFGKAVGLCGGMVLGNNPLINHIRAHCRGYIYTTALPIPIVATLISAKDVIHHATEQRHQLQLNIAQFRDQLQAQFQQYLTQSNSPIQPICIGEPTAAIQFSDALNNHGIIAKAVHHPTVPKHQSRCRLTITSRHSRDNILAITTAIQQELPSIHTPTNLIDAKY